MDRYLINKFKGTYRIRAKLDTVTNDFIRDADGNLDDSFADFYIKCSNGFEIYHYYRDILGVYNENPTKGRNLIRKIYEDKLSTPAPQSLKRVVDKLLKEEIILSYLDTDCDFDIHFKISEMDYFASLLKPETNGKSISPFSTKNLPKTTYIIPDNDLKKYTEITQIFGDDMTTKMPTISKLNKAYKDKKNDELKKFDFDKDMRLAKLKFKQYIHFKGWWDEYLEFLRGCSK